MPSLTYGFRSIRIEQRHFWADGGDEFYIVSRSLADVIAAIDLTEDSYAAGTQPDWENRWNKVTVVADLAKALPQHAIPEAESLYPDEIFRTQPGDRCKHDLWWIAFVPEGSPSPVPFVRAFSRKERAERWLELAKQHNAFEADALDYAAIERNGFWGG
ncbi:hypothetical protein [uncultured Methylobacterium sp.]|uniref:hypothetical protein n=1 Tax=uncultured Methylobacterium sp. TaxID=157278 RepID=UPI00260CA1F4|nr:hypothetical protein [uncultured Methylobacterium sp.]